MAKERSEFAYGSSEVIVGGGRFGGGIFLWKKWIGKWIRFDEKFYLKQKIYSSDFFARVRNSQFSNASNNERGKKMWDQKTPYEERKFPLSDAEFNEMLSSDPNKSEDEKELDDNEPANDVKPNQ
ncbi:hypothetical protein U1Q18_050677, partial [Sarracenia purpurea var. burkii]